MTGLKHALCTFALLLASGHAAQAQDTDACTLLYQEAKDLDACFAFEAYVETCPDHPFSAIGKKYVEQQCAAPTEQSENATSDPDEPEMAAQPPTEPQDEPASATTSEEPAAEAASGLTAAAEKALKNCHAAIPDYWHPDDPAYGTSRSYLIWRDLPTGTPEDCRIASLATEDPLLIAKHGVALVDRRRFSEAVDVLERAVAFGDPMAMTSLAQLYSWRKTAFRNVERARSLAERAADLGYAPAHGFLAETLSNDDFGPKDYAASLRHAEAGHAMGEPKSTALLGDFWFYGWGSMQSDDMQAVSYYQKAADLNEPRGLTGLGNAYYVGRGVEKDVTTARSLWERGAEGGDGLANENLGEMYQNGDGVVIDLARAFTYFSAAHAAGRAHGTYETGTMLLFGEGVSPDPKRGKALLLEALKNGVDEAAVALGLAYEFGKGLPKDTEKAAEMYLHYARTGDTTFTGGLIKLYWNGHATPEDTDEVMKLLTDAADAKDAEAQFYLARNYWEGKWTDKDDAKAFEHFERAVENGHRDSLNWLAYAYEAGIGTKEDPRQAANHYLAALKNGRDWVLRRDNKITRATLRQLQRLLRAEGTYTGAIDGLNGPGTRRAMQAIVDRAKEG